MTNKNEGFDPENIPADLLEKWNHEAKSQDRAHDADLAEILDIQVKLASKDRTGVDRIVRDKEGEPLIVFKVP